ncbi:MAG: cysteine hydrolase [Aigarchaeota archaeon]|nr:cysteine hydrolase [Aigarchaeota archaeon]MDW8092945.1 isochorismatase family cysteine hydrolase [Nitrososphaerota archaeon]
MKRALIIVDMTNDFLLKKYNPNLAHEKGLELVPKIRELQEAFLKKGHPVIFATDRHLPTDFELKKWGPHSMKGSEGSKIVNGLLKEGVYVLERGWKIEDVNKIPKGQLLFEVEKGTYSGFTDNGGTPTAMDALLKKLGLGPGDKLYITGLHTNCCDKHTAADAWFRGYVPVIVNDCVSAMDDPKGEMGMGHNEALKYEKFWYNAEVKRKDEVLKELSENS